MSVNKRRAEFVYDAARLAAIAAEAPIVPVVYAEREQAFKDQFERVIEKQSGDERSHDARRVAQQLVECIHRDGMGLWRGL